MDLEALTAVPGILDGGGTAQRFHLVHDIQFAELVRFRFWVGDRIESFMVPEVKIFDFREPIIDQAVVCAGHGGLDPAATVVSANDDMFDLQNLHRELNDRNTVQIRRIDQIRYVSMDEQFSRQQTNDLVRWYSAVSASDPKELW